jgi:hypothetical protein
MLGKYIWFVEQFKGREIMMTMMMYMVHTLGAIASSIWVDDVAPW